jgi:hypothetical protein
MAEHMRRRRPLALFAQIEHPDGDGRFWTGTGVLRWNGASWQGSAQLGTITPIRHTSDLVIQEIQFQMSGVDPDLVAQLNDDVRNRSGIAWLAGIYRGSVVPDPLRLVDSQLDYQSYDVGEDGRATIAITARSGFYTLDRAMDEAWTTEEHQLEYPDDTGLDLIPSLQNQDIIWTPS